jgi:hypothetical protein
VDISTWGPAEVEAAATVGGLVIAIVVAVFAWVQLRQAKHLREEQARPYVIVDIDFRGFGVSIVVQNIGATPAYDVRVTFDKLLETTMTRRKPLEEVAVFARPIPMVAPGRSIHVPFDRMPNRLKRADLPTEYVATVKYRDSKKKWVPPEEYPFDLATYADTLSPKKGLPEVATAVQELNKSLKSVKTNNALRVLTSDHDRESRREAREVAVEKFARTVRASGLLIGFRKSLAMWVQRNRWRWGG